MSNYTVHTYDPDSEGRCQWPWVDKGGMERTCDSSQRASVMHDDPEAEFREMHWHGGGDCMCFEAEDGPDFHEAMRRYAHPTEAEILEEEHQRELQRRRNARVNALSRGQAIARLARRLTADSPPEDIHRYIERALKMTRWGGPMIRGRRSTIELVYRATRHRGRKASVRRVKHMLHERATSWPRPKRDIVR